VLRIWRPSHVRPTPRGQRARGAANPQRSSLPSSRLEVCPAPFFSTAPASHARNSSSLHHQAPPPSCTSRRVRAPGAPRVVRAEPRTIAIIHALSSRTLAISVELQGEDPRRVPLTMASRSSLSLSALSAKAAPCSLGHPWPWPGAAPTTNYSSHDVAPARPCSAAAALSTMALALSPHPSRAEPLRLDSHPHSHLGPLFGDTTGQPCFIPTIGEPAPSWISDHSTAMIPDMSPCVRVCGRNRLTRRTFVCSPPRRSHRFRARARRVLTASPCCSDSVVEAPAVPRFPSPTAVSPLRPCRCLR
jgi:hypothetical protein